MIICDIKVVPSSGKQMFKRDKTGMVVCYLKSAPERGAANAELVKVIAQACSIPQADVILIGGLTSRKKRIKIASIDTQEDFLYALGISDQLKLC